MMSRVFETQLYDYLRGTEYRLGFLVNFGDDKLDIRRRIYDDKRDPRKSAKPSASIRVQEARAT